MIKNPASVVLHSDNLRKISFGYTFPLTFVRRRWQGKREVMAAAAKTTLVTRDWKSFWVWEGSSTSSFSPLSPLSALSGPGTCYNSPSPSGMANTGAHCRLKLRQSMQKFNRILNQVSLNLVSQSFLKLGDTNVSFEDSANQAFMTLKCASQIKEFVIRICIK